MILHTGRETMAEGPDSEHWGATVTAPADDERRRPPPRNEALSHEEWDGLVRLWAEVARFPLGQPEEATRHGLICLARLLGGCMGGALLLARGKHPTDRNFRAFAQWRPVHLIAMAPDGAVLDHALDAFFKEGAYVNDPVVQRTHHEAGRRRAYLYHTMIHGRLPGAPLDELFRAFGSQDRVFGVLPIAPDLEISIAVDRPPGTPFFTTRDRTLLLEAMRGLEPTLTALARWGGYIDCREPLTPKERVVLQWLLTGRKEDDIAARLGMGRRSLHQRVVDVYRKFGVNSRPQLMALWLSWAKD